MLAAIEEFKRTDGAGLSDSDSLLLARFNQEDWDEYVNTVGQFFVQHRKDPDHGRRFISDILAARHYALEAPEMRAAWDPALEDVKRTKWCADQICGFLLSKRVEFHDGTSAQQLIQLLSWLRTQLTLAEARDIFVAAAPADHSQNASRDCPTRIVHGLYDYRHIGHLSRDASWHRGSTG